MTASPALGDLLRGAVEGDHDAAAELYDQTIDGVWRVARVAAPTTESAQAAVASAYRDLISGVAEVSGDVRLHLLRTVYVRARGSASLGWAGEPAQHRGRRRRRARRLPARALRPGPQLHPGRESTPA